MNVTWTGGYDMWFLRLEGRHNCVEAFGALDC